MGVSNHLAVYLQPFRGLVPHLTLKSLPRVKSLNQTPHL